MLKAAVDTDIIQNVTISRQNLKASLKDKDGG